MSYGITSDNLIRLQFARGAVDLEPWELQRLLSNALLQARLKGLIHRAGGVGTPPRPGALEADQAAEVFLPTSVGSPS